VAKIIIMLIILVIVKVYYCFVGVKTPLHWEDITGSTSLKLVNDCVTFTTTLSGRFE